jgi:glycosyltransferase involved in cell wall biosynthesis
MDNLVIYTNSYPYGSSEVFLETEINYLVIHFKKIIIIPFSGNGEARIVPAQIKIYPPIQVKIWNRLSVYLSGINNFPKFLKKEELRREIRSLSLLKFIKYIGYAGLVKKRIQESLQSEPFLYYSYWLNYNAFCLSLLRQEGFIPCLICRAHGYDLYNERGETGLNFLKPATLKNLDRLYLISDHGRKYMIAKYPEFSDKFFLSRLGTQDHKFENPLPDKQCLTLVSCSAIVKNKRIHLILETLILFNKLYPSIKIFWYHLGTGEELKKYIEIAGKSMKNSNAQCIFMDQMDNRKIFNFYRTVPVDLFLNVSEFEGIPVSIMEAMSFSIPVVAPNTGGIPEIVNNDNGLLLSPAIDPKALAEILQSVYRNKEAWEIKRKAARQTWISNFNAEKNYNSFSEELSTIIIPD